MVSFRRSAPLGTSLATALAVLFSAMAAQAQDAADHLAHHAAGAQPGAPAIPASTRPDPQQAGKIAAPAPGGAAQAMGAMGDTCGEGCMSAARAPLYSRLLVLPQVTEEERHAIASEGRRRMDAGSALLAQAAREAQWGASMRDEARLLRAGGMSREGEALLASGAAAHAALARGAQGPQVALDWFRREMSLAPATSHARPWWGANAGHFILMTALTLLAASLLALQILRRERARSVLAGARASHPAAAAPASPVAVAPAGARASGDSRRPWKGELRVAQVVRETPTVATFRLVHPAGSRLPFDFLPGQFLQVEVEPTPGSPVKRSYTIASPPTRTGHVELTVKREDLGVVSAYLHDRVEAGALVKVAGPYGAFTFSGADADSIVLIAGGVGVTPIMSVLRYLTDLAWPGQIFFIYSARSTEEMLFREELEHLERRHPNLSVLCTVATRTPGTSWLGPEGMLTRELLQGAVPDLGRRRIHLCGPPPMMAVVKALLQELGVPPQQLHTEAFGPASLPVQEPPPGEAARPPPTRKPRKTPGPQVAPQIVTFSIAGVSAPLPADRTVLEAAEAAGVEIPYSCRSGVCGLCVVKLKQGSVTMAVEDGLESADKAAGYVLACQAKSAGGNLVVEA